MTLVLHSAVACTFFHVDKLTECYTLETVLTEYQLQHHLLRATCGPGFRSALL